jgi:hypothetical protein
MSSINLSLLDRQTSNAISQSYVEVENEDDNLEDDSDRSFRFNKNTRHILN